MQVWASGAACIAARAEPLAGLHNISCSNADFGHMQENRNQAIAVVEERSTSEIIEIRAGT